MRRFALLFLIACTPSADQPAPAAATSAPTRAYNRSEWGRWQDDDGDCQNTRQEVLIAESLEPVVLDARGCKVLSGRWKCPLTGKVFTDPSKLDIDHLVPLKVAHDTGGAAWSKEAKRIYFNDLKYPGHLIATSASANRSKGSKTPLEWMPPNKAFRCQYLQSWMIVKRTYKLDVSCKESGAIADMMATMCRP